MILVLVAASLPLLIGLAIVGLRSPATVLFAAYAALVPMGSAFDVPIPLPSPFDTLSSVAGVVAGVGVLVELVVSGRRARRWSRTLPPVLVFLGWTAITLGWSIAPGDTMNEVALLFSVVSVYAVLAMARIDEDEVDRIATAILIGGTIASLYGMGLLAIGRGTNGDLGAPRLAIIGDDPNHTAAALLLPFMLACHRVLAGRGRLRLLPAGAAVSIFAAVYLTGSRGGLLALFAGVGVLTLAGPSVRQARIAAAVLAVAVLVAVTVAPSDLQSRLTDPSSTGRTTIWRLGLRSCDRFCVQGSGWGTFPQVYQEEFRIAPDAGGYRTGAFKAHNVWLQAFVETGLIGLGALVATFALAVLEAFALPRHRRGPPAAALISLALASTLISNMTFKYFWLVLTFAALSATARPRPADAISSALEATVRPETDRMLVPAAREG